MPSTICRYLSTLISEGSFSKAAQTLNISQPSLSQFIVRLETEAQTELVDRAARPLKLTAAGELYLRTEEHVDLLRETAAKQMLDIKSGTRGRVVVGMTDYRESYFLAEVLPTIRKRYPLVEISVVEGNTKELEELALAGVTDFSIVIAPLFHKRGLTTETLYRERILLALSENHPIAVAHPADPRNEFPTLSFRELDREPFIKLKKGQQLEEIYAQLCDAAGIEPRVVLESESMNAVYTLAGVGLGAALTTETLVRRAHTNKPIRAFSIEPQVEPRIVAAAYRTDRYLSKAAKALIDVMKTESERKFERG